jgi:hypothetical protein
LWTFRLGWRDWMESRLMIDDVCIGGWNFLDEMCAPLEL